MCSCPQQGCFQSFVLGTFAQDNESFDLHQRLPIWRLHVKVRRRMVVGIDFYFPVSFAMKGSHTSMLGKFFL